MVNRNSRFTIHDSRLTIHENMTTPQPNIILASYPRSGNTYLRNILHDVYNIYSWNNIDKYNNALKRCEELEKKEDRNKLDEDKKKNLDILRQQLMSPVLKTHEMPDKVLHLCKNDPVIIYLVRDGRDSLVSMAHHRVDIVKPGSKFNWSLQQSILAPMGSHFGGWSKNVKAWREIAHKVIRFEELIAKPLETVEGLRGILDLPLPDKSRIPTFESQREGKSYFGGQARENLSEKEKKEFNQKFFRSGKVGGWKDDMSSAMHKLFWTMHGKVSREMGYKKDGSLGEIKWKKGA